MESARRSGPENFQGTLSDKNYERQMIAMILTLKNTKYSLWLYYNILNYFNDLNMIFG